jgi:hypothetical protein
VKRELFNELLESVKQGGTIRRGKMKPSRAFNFEPINVVAIRKKVWFIAG